MKKTLTLHVLIAFLLAVSISASARQNKPDLPPSKSQGTLVENKVYTNESIFEKVEPSTVSKPALRSTQTVGEVDGRLLLYSEHMYDGNGNLSQITDYTYDALYRQTSMTTYVRNDYSEDWMYDREGMICSYKMNRTISTPGYVTFYESYTLDWTTGKLKGDSKYYRTFNELPEIENYDLSYESYNWNDTIDAWVGDYKYTCDYTYFGNNLLEEDFYWDRDESTKSWNKNYDNKYTFNYLHENNFWYTIQSKDYKLIDGVYQCTYESTSVPNIATNSYLSTTTKTLTNNVLENESKSIYSYTTTGRNLLMDYYRWKDNDWKLLIKYVYDYTSPDSICTQTNYKTPAYYQFYGNTQPTLCAGQTMNAYRRYITKNNPVVGTEFSYNYSWDNNNCKWIPGGAKFLYTLDAIGKHPISYINCSTYNNVDWTNCSLKTTNYYPDGKIKETIQWTDGSINQQKSVYIYDESNYLTKIVYYYSYDWNNDGIIDSTEWYGNGYKDYIRKFSIGFDTDSVHLTVQNAGSLSYYYLDNVKKLKITGPLSCEDLSYIAKSSWSKLQTADLSEATIEGDTLREDCFGKIGLNTLILPNNLVAIEKGAISNSNYYDEEDYDYLFYGLRTLVINPTLQYLARGGIEAMTLNNLSIRSDLLNNLFDFEMDIPGIIDVYKTTLKHITLNDLSGKIKDAVCYNMPYLESATILDGASEIGNNAFKSCGMLSNVSLPPSTLRKIGHNAFWGCNELTSLTIPEGTTTIDYSAFWGCSGINFIQMPSTLTSIAQNAFWGCSAVGTMNVNAATPPLLGNNALVGIPRTASLIVPPSGFDAYKLAPQWKEFYLVKSGLIVSDPNTIQVYGTNNQLQLQNIPAKTSVQIFNITGLKVIDLVNPVNAVTLNLQPGIYLVKIGDQRFKTVVQ